MTPPQPPSSYTRVAAARAALLRASTTLYMYMHIRGFGGTPKRNMYMYIRYILHTPTGLTTGRSRRARSSGWTALFWAHASFSSASSRHITRLESVVFCLPRAQPRRGPVNKPISPSNFASSWAGAPRRAKSCPSQRGYRRRLSRPPAETTAHPIEGSRDRRASESERYIPACAQYSASVSPGPPAVWDSWPPTWCALPVGGGTWPDCTL